MRSIHLLLGTVVIALALAAGCTTARQPSGVAADVAGLFREAGMTSPPLECRTLSSEADAVCRFAADTAAIERAAAGLQLHRLDRHRAMDRARLRVLGADSCLDLDRVDPTRVDVLASFGRPQALQLLSGRRLEYALLFFTADARQACLRISYARPERPPRRR